MVNNLHDKANQIQKDLESNLEQMDSLLMTLYKEDNKEKEAELSKTILQLQKRNSKLLREAFQNSDERRYQEAYRKDISQDDFIEEIKNALQMPYFRVNISVDTEFEEVQLTYVKKEIKGKKVNYLERTIKEHEDDW